MSIVSLRHGLRTQDKITQITRLLAPLGGVDTYFCPGETVAILADWGLPLSAAAGVNAHPALIYAISKIALANGAKEVRVLLQPAAGFDFQQTLQRSGYDDLAKESIHLINLAQQQLLNRQTTLNLHQDTYPIYQPLLSADVLISVSKFKCDKNLLFGSAISNLAAGAAVEHSPGMPPASRIMADLSTIITADLHIVDGFRGNAGYQPQKEDFLAAATDPWALDTVLTAIANIPSAAIPYLCLGAQYALGCCHPGDIMVVGDTLPTTSPS